MARRLAFELEQPEEALRVLDEAGDHPGLGVVRAEILLAGGRVAEARSALAVTLSRSAEIEPATLREAIERAARGAQARVEAAEGEAALGEGRREEALFAMRRAAALDPAWREPRARLDALRPRTRR